MADSLKALTITPCWAHAVMHLGKKIENRKWTPNYRGPLLIHAGKNFKMSEFEQICEHAKEDGKRPPQQENILVGGIVGMVDFYKVVEESDNIWFGGPYGWVFRKIRHLPFLPMNGQLGLFNVDPPVRWREQAGL
jgi:hypothetical protein